MKGIRTRFRGETETRSGAEADSECVRTDDGINSRDEGVVVEVDQLIDVARVRDDNQTQRTAARPPQQHQSSLFPRLHSVIIQPHAHTHSMDKSDASRARQRTSSVSAVASVSGPARPGNSSAHTRPGLLEIY